MYSDTTTPITPQTTLDTLYPDIKEYKQVIHDRIVKILVKEYKILDYESTDNLMDVFGDSLSILEAAMALEEEFDINIPSVDKMRTMGDVEQFIFITTNWDV